MINDIFGNSNKINEVRTEDIAEKINANKKIEDLKPVKIEEEKLIDVYGNDITEELLNDLSNNLKDFKPIMVDIDDDGVVDFIISSNGANLDKNSLNQNLQDNILDCQEHNFNENIHNIVRQHEGFNDNTIGNPFNELNNWHLQQFNDSEAIVSQEFVIKKLLDIDVDEVKLRDLSIENNWHCEGSGTPLFNIGKILEHYNIYVDEGFNRNMENITKCIGESGSVIVAIDGDCLSALGRAYDGGGILKTEFSPQKNSITTAEVIGIDRSDKYNISIILNQSGYIGGAGMRISESDFLNAWGYTNNYMLEAYKSI